MTTLQRWEKSTRACWFKLAPFAALAATATAALAQTPASLGRSYHESPTPARRKALERYALSHKDANGALANFTLGEVSFEQKQYSDAIRHLQAAQPRLPKLADYMSYYLAVAHSETGDNAAAVNDAAAVRSTVLRSPFAAGSVTIQARALAASGSAQDAIRMLREQYTDVPQPDGDLALAIAYEAAHNLPKAAEYYMRVYYEYPTSDQATRAGAALVTMRNSLGASCPGPSAQQMIVRANKLLAQGEYARARSEFQNLVPQLTGAERDQARTGIGAAQYLSGDVASAYSYLRSLEVSDREADAERLYYLVECAKRLNDDDQMMDAVKQLNKRHGESPWHFKALMDAANRYLVANQHEKSTPLYKAAYEGFPNQPLAANCHWKVTWDAYIHRKQDAGELLREHLQRYPGHPSASAALYFLGRLSESQKDYATARTYYIRLTSLFPNYYYGVLARERMAQANVIAAGPSAKTVQFLGTIAFPARKTNESARPDAQTSLRIARACLIKSAGLPDLAEAELRFGIRNDNQPYLLAIELAHTADTAHERLRSMKKAVPDYLSMSLEDAPPTFWQLLFPLPYQKDLVSCARRQNLDPYMVAALIRQESEFNPQALSSAHAYGLTQVVPSTGRALARRAGVRRFSNRALFQPSINLKLGTYYLRSLLDQWGGKWEQTLASYNAGKSRVSDWLAWNNYEEPAEFVESIPFTETRDYVEAVLRNAAVYRELYGARKISARESARKAGHSRRAHRIAHAA
jgi:soluble lytic murein transglycosylase